MSGRFLRGTVLASGMLFAGLALGQYALDAYFGVGQSKINKPREPVTMGKQLYKVDYATGEMRYDRAKAFNDPIYNIYARQRDPFEFGTRPVSRRPPRPGSIAPAKASMAQPSYVPRKQRQSPMSSDMRVGLRSPSYSPTRTRAQRISPTRVR